MIPEKYNLKLIDMNIEKLKEKDLQWADLILTCSTYLLLLSKAARPSACCVARSVLEAAAPPCSTTTLPLLPTTLSTGLEVKVLPSTCWVPDARVQGLITGPPETFREEIGFSDPSSAPGQPTIALWFELANGSPRAHEFLVGGPVLDIKFPMSHFFGLDGKSSGGQDTEIQAKQDPSLIKIRQGTKLSEWELLQEKFQDSLASPGCSIQWNEGTAIYAR